MRGSVIDNPLVRSSDLLPRNPDKSAPSVIPRRTRITPADLKTYGFTVGCQGCESIEMGHDQRRKHSEACRQRIEAAMKESEAGQELTARLMKNLVSKARGDSFWVKELLGTFGRAGGIFL